jgi:hypothetical protein
MKSVHIGYAIIITVLLSASLVFAQDEKSLLKYDPDTEITIIAGVEQVEEHACPMGWTCTRVIMKTDNDTYDVHLGPSTFLADQKLTVVKGDELVVTGSKVLIGDVATLIARSVAKNGHLFMLRTPRGYPLWTQQKPH